MSVYWNDGTELYHYGIPGMKWGQRRYQNEDGTYTEEGKRRYGRVATGIRRINKTRLENARNAHIRDEKDLRKHGYKEEADAVAKVREGIERKLKGLEDVQSISINGQVAAKYALAVLGTAAVGAGIAAIYADKVNEKEFNSLMDRAENAWKRKEYYSESSELHRMQAKDAFSDYIKYKNEARSMPSNTPEQRINKNTVNTNAKLAFSRGKTNTRMSKSDADLAYDYIMKSSKYKSDAMSMRNSNKYMNKRNKK